MAQTVYEPGRTLPIYGEYDVVVLGGGPAGMMAAAAAAQTGAHTLLIERYGFLGGMGTAAGVTNFCGLHANVYGQHQRVVRGLTDEFLDLMRELDGLCEPHVMFGGKIMAQAYDTPAYKIAADRLLLKRRVELLFHTQAAGALLNEDRSISELIVETRGGRQAIRAKRFIDCSGDGDLAYAAGSPMEQGSGREDMLYPSTLFRINGVQPERAGKAWETVAGMMEKAEQDGWTFKRRMPIMRPQRNPVEWRCNVTQLSRDNGDPISGTDSRQMTEGELSGRAQAAHFIQFLREYMPGFEQSYILDLPPQLGIRETRRLQGALQLSEHDVLNCTSFEDTIGVNAWPIEEHRPGEVSFEFPPIPDCRGFNHLPYRMLYSSKVGNLLVAGRCASMTHKGQSAARVTGACFVMGQAAGTAAAMSIEQQCPPAALPVRTLQTRLEADGVYLGTDIQ
ncbi:MAG: FAD-dependent oxidoreductase [Pigmentiphaga sp.]|nr:FAD-dependent oxidoreductase [Pigmentiphaga sp.]